MQRKPWPSHHVGLRMIVVRDKLNYTRISSHWLLPHVKCLWTNYGAEPCGNCRNCRSNHIHTESITKIILLHPFPFRFAVYVCHRTMDFTEWKVLQNERLHRIREYTERDTSPNYRFHEFWDFMRVLVSWLYALMLSLNSSFWTRPNRDMTELLPTVEKTVEPMCIVPCLWFT